MTSEPSVIRHYQVKRLILDFRAVEGQDPTYDDIAYFCRMRPQTIARILRRLEVCRELRVCRTPGRRNHYEIIKR